MKETIVELNGISKRYGPVTAVDDVSLSVSAGEFLVLLGPSGSGKTTILSMIGGFTSPSSGEIRIKGMDMTNTPPAGRPTVTVFQDYALFPHMSVRQNVSFGLKMRKISKKERYEKAEKSLETVGLSGFGDRGIHQLSGGQRQRVALARAIAVEPAVLLLDEPLGALDLKIRQQMQGELVDLQKRIGSTFVHVTHDQEEAMSIADNIALVNEGKIEDYGPPERVYLQPATLFTARFMGESNILEGTVRSVHGTKITIRSKLCELSAISAVSTVLDAGDQIHVSIRPEQIKIGDLSGHGYVRLGDVKVDELVFQGTHRSCKTTVQSGDEMPLNIRLQPDEKVRVGDTITICVKTNDIAILTK